MNNSYLVNLVLFVYNKNNKGYKEVFQIGKRREKKFRVWGADWGGKSGLLIY